MSSESAQRFNKEYIPCAEDYVRRDGSKPTGRGIPIEDTWNCSEADRLDSIMIKSFSREKVGYSTQKPLALLERLIKASSNLGDLVLDPFCGSGTTVATAHNLGRRWLGIDISAAAIDLTDERRLQPMGIRAETFGIPRDLTSARKLAAEKPFDFEGWAVSRIPGLAPVKGKSATRVSMAWEIANGRGSPSLQACRRSGKRRQSLPARPISRFLACIGARECRMWHLHHIGARSFAQRPRRGNCKRRYPSRRQALPARATVVDPRIFRAALPRVTTLADPFTGKPIQPSLWSKQI